MSGWPVRSRAAASVGGSAFQPVLSYFLLLLLLLFTPETMLEASVRVCVGVDARAHAIQGTPTSADRTKAEATGAATIQT